MKASTIKRSCLFIFIVALLALSIAYYSNSASNVKAAYSDDNWVNFKATAFATGSGDGSTSEKAYRIATAEQLAYFASNVNGGINYIGKFIKLTANIDLQTHYWTAIGKLDKQFCGSFDGNGFNIENIRIISSDDYQGLFGYINGGEVLNVGVSGNIVGKNFIGGITGYCEDAIINNCFNLSTLSGSENVGGIAGKISDTLLTNCYNTGTVSGTNVVGGITGNTSLSSVIISCFNSGNISGTIFYVGGISGESSASTINNCYNTGHISASAYAGGISGRTLNSSVSNCYNIGTLSGTYGIGGIAGSVTGSSVANCYYNINIPFDAVGSSYEGSTINSDNVKGLSLTQMTGATALDAVNMVFKYVSGTSADYWQLKDNTGAIPSREFYCPQLKVFATNSNTQIKADSLHSVTVKEVAKPVAKEGLYFNGGAQVGINYNSDAVSYNGNISATAVGSYTCVFTLKKGYIWTDGTITDVSVTYSILKANGEGTLLLDSWSYGQQNNSPSYWVTKGDYISTSLKFYYKPSTSSDWLELTSYPTAVGSYDIKLELAETSNYNKLILTTSFSILPTQLTNQLGEIEGIFIYNGLEHTPSAVVTGLTSDDYDVSYTNNINAGIATLTITGKGNYSGTISKTFIIEKAEGSGSVTIKGWREGQTPKEPSAMSFSNIVNDVEYAYKVKGSDDSTYSSTVPTTRGKYTVCATFAATANYDSFTATADFSIGYSIGVVIGISVGSAVIIIASILVIFMSSNRKKKINLN